MKFYFCDKCGKRVTEQDLAAGQARDKQLAGIFCAGCAAGVTTNPHEAVQEASQAVVGVRPPTGSVRRSGAHAAPPRRRTTGQAAQLAPPRAAGPREGRKPRLPSPGAFAEEPRPRGRQSAALAFWGAVAVVVLGLVAGGMWVVLTTPRDKAQAKSIEPPSRKPKLVEGPPVEPVVQTVEAPAPPDVTPNPAEPLESAARADYQKLIRFEDLDPQDHAGRLKRVEAFLEQHEHSDLAAEARALREKLQADLAMRPPPDLPPDVPEPQERVAPVPAEPEPFDHAIVDALGGVLKDLREEGIEKASASIQNLADEPGARHAEILAQLQAAMTLLTQREAKRMEALAHLRGQEASLETTVGLKKGRVLEVKDDLLLIQPEYRVNGQLRKGEIFKLKASQLTEAEWLRLVPDPEPKTAAQHLARVLTCAARDEIPLAEAALSPLEGQPTEPILRQCLDLRRQEASFPGSDGKDAADRLPKAADLKPFAFAVELRPVADAQVNTRWKGNLGVLPYMHACTGGAGESRVLMRFSLKGLHPSTRISKAILNLDEIKGSPQELDFHEVDSGAGAWTELDVSFESLPRPGKRVVRAGLSGRPPKVSADLTELLARAVSEGRPVLDLWINGTKNNEALGFCAREGPSPPVLSLEGEARVPPVILDLPENCSIQNAVKLDAHVVGAKGGETLAVRWEKIEGPGRVAFRRSNQAQTEAFFSAPGKYLLRLDAQQGARRSAADATVLVSGISIRQEPHADTFVVKGSPDNFGKKHELGAIWVHGADGEKQALLRFDLRSLPPGFVLHRAVLRLYQVRGSHSQITLHSIDDASGAQWLEEKVAWDSMPKTGERVRRYPKAKDAGWRDLDVTSWVRERLEGAKAQISFAVEGQANNEGLTFVSREGRSPPELALFGYRK